MLPEKRDAIVEWLKPKLDDHAHGIVTTADKQGSMASSEYNGEGDALLELADRVGMDYEHDHTDCKYCAEERKWMQQDLDYTEEEMDEMQSVYHLRR